MFFNLFNTNKKINLFISYSFILSFFYFYNYEIEALSLILSTPFLYLILMYSLKFDENLNDLSNIFLIKYTFVWATFLLFILMEQ